jgi:ABC-type transporter Mla subunit MlaD
VAGLVVFSRAFGQDTPETRRRARLVMQVVYVLLLLLGLGFLYAGLSTTPPQYRVVVQAVIFNALGAGGLLMSRRHAG